MKQQALTDIFTKCETQIYALCNQLKYTEYIYIHIKLPTLYANIKYI